MRSNNPVLSKADSWQTQPVTGQFAPGQTYPGQVGAPYDPQFQPAQPDLRQQGVMTIDDVITKSAVVMGVLMLTAALTFMYLPAQLLYPAMIIAGLVAFGTVMLESFRRAINPGFVLAYAAIEGVFIGAISKVFESLYPGIVTPAAVSYTHLTLPTNREV